MAQVGGWTAVMRVHSTRYPAPPRPRAAPPPRRPRLPAALRARARGDEVYTSGGAAAEYLTQRGVFVIGQTQLADELESAGMVCANEGATPQRAAPPQPDGAATPVTPT
eukprot:gene17205-24230_t